MIVIENGELNSSVVSYENRLAGGGKFGETNAMLMILPNPCVSIADFQFLFPFLWMYTITRIISVSSEGRRNAAWLFKKAGSASSFSILPMCIGYKNYTHTTTTK